MASRRRQSVQAIIRRWAPRFRLDPRAVASVATAEGGLRWGAVGDQGTSFGPFQLHVGGALPRGKNAAWANSEAGIRYALRRMAASGASGLKGRAAISAIVRNFERPAAPGPEIDRAASRYGGINLGAGGSDFAPGGNGVPSLLGGEGGNKRTQIAQFLLNKSRAEVEGTNAPSLLDLAQQLRVENDVPNNPRPVAATGVQFSGPGGVPDPIKAGLLAQRLGLHVSENPYFDQVDPVHVKDSDHYKVLGKYRGKKYGAAIDVSGNAAVMAKYFHLLEKKRLGLNLNDMFYDPAGYSYDRGRRWNRTIGGHGTHVHASFFR